MRYIEILMFADLIFVIFIVAQNISPSYTVVKAWFRVLYMYVKQSTRDMVKRVIQHEVKPSAVWLLETTP